MTRPTHIEVNAGAIRHNVAAVKRCAPGKQVIAMVKADAYGCGVPAVTPVLDAFVDAFGVASFEEAKEVRQYTQKPCLLLEGIFTQDELFELVDNQFEMVVHCNEQLDWLLDAQLKQPIRVWIKIDTGMHRLGFMPDEAQAVIAALQACPGVQDNIGVLTHFASADKPEHVQNQLQYDAFSALALSDGLFTKSIANSAIILSYPERLFDAVRPGIMLYGVSPFFEKDAVSIGLKPVMQFISEITAIHPCAVGEHVGYDAAWEALRPSRIGIVAVGYGDGYPRHIAPDTVVYIEGQYVPIVGRISMDMLTIDLTDYPEIQKGSRVELWGAHLPVERVARAAGTIGYELISQITPRVRAQTIIIERE
ncbi:MAG: alanine racemase [Gammaproteobacteria bacterium]|nr:alanine racemase [Gammaproteobacteria bacterium]MCH9763495.1 alanine racemase [Gammaproteobacteria bacterium]